MRAGRLWRRGLAWPGVIISLSGGSGSERTYVDDRMLVMIRSLVHEVGTRAIMRESLPAITQEGGACV